MASTTQQEVSQRDASEDQALQIWVPAELKERLRIIGFERRVTYRDLVIEALERAYPPMTRKKAS